MSRYLSIANGAIAASGANYAVIYSDGTAETSLNGYSYIDNQNSVIVKTGMMIEGTEERAIKIDKGTLINKNNSQTVAQYLYNYYQRQQVFDGDFVMTQNNPEKIGDIVKIATVFDEDINELAENSTNSVNLSEFSSKFIMGQIEKLSLSLGYANIKARSVIRGN